MKRRNTIKNGIYIGIISLVFLAVLVFGLKERENRQLYFALENGSETVKIMPYESEDGETYVFLPSYADFSGMRIMTPADVSVSLGGIPVSNGMYCNDFSSRIPYGLVMDDVWVSDLIFMKSENLPSMHIDTASGNMSWVHRDKENTEEASVRLYGEDGAVTFRDAGSVIQGRGNYTWDQEKKPYSLELSYEADLLGMGSSSEWILLANVADGSNLNNKLVLDLANQFCPEWTPECEFVDLYLNGEYAGLYLLTERIETVKDKLDLDLTAGEYLCRIDYPGRYEIIRNPILTQAGRVAYVAEPKQLSETEKNKIAQQIQELEDLILSGGDLSEVEWFDLDSWVRKYLIDEVSMNGDADLASSYFYRKNGIFYAGPMWDYDVCFGNRDRTKDPTVFYAKNMYKSFHQSLYYNAIYENPDFFARVQEIYRDDFLPLLKELLEVGIEQQERTVKSAAEMDNIRWEELYDLTFSSNLLFRTTPESIREYLELRLAFLNSVWIDGERYYTIQFDSADTKIFSIPEGQLLVTDDEEILNYTWADIETGEILELYKPITKDMYLQVIQSPAVEEPVISEEQPVENMEMEPAAPEVVLTEEDILVPPVSAEKEVSTRAVVMVVSVVLMAGVFLWMVVVEWKKHSRKKEYAYE